MSFQLMAWASEQTTGSPTRKAVLLALANAANHHTGECFPAVERICEETELGDSAVRRALAALVEQGLIGRARRRRQDGSLGTYTYTFPHVERAPDLPVPEPEPPVRGTGGLPVRGAARNLEVPNRRSEPTVPHVDAGRPAAVMVTRRGWKVDGRQVTEQEEQLARSVLAEWNREARQSLAARSWLAKIVMRHREHPELTVADHAALIHRTLAEPWWRGAASPSVLYGNDAIFERAMTTASMAAPAERALDIAEAAINEARRQA